MFHETYTKFYDDNHGVGAIEFAILLPIFLILSLGVMEFGMYFVKDEIINSTISTISQTIQRDPTYYQSLTPAQLTQLEKSYGSGLIDFTKPGNYICVDTYSTQAAAAGAVTCTSTHFNTTNPGITTPYYIAVRGNLPKGGITPLGNFVSGVKNIQVNQSSGIVAIGNLTPPACTTPGYFLQYNPANATATPPKNPWECNPISQSGSGVGDCSAPWQKMVFNPKLVNSDGTNGMYGCMDIPWTFAAGIANPTSSGPSAPLTTLPSNSPVTGPLNDSGGFWLHDNAYAPWIYASHGQPSLAGGGSVIPYPNSVNPLNLNYVTLCANSPVGFTIPALPPGLILAQGNLNYFDPSNCPEGSGCGSGNGDWHTWVVSFVDEKLSGAPTTTSSGTGGTGSAFVCESNSGNFQDYGIGAEHVSWSETYIPADNGTITYSNGTTGSYTGLTSGSYGGTSR